MSTIWAVMEAARAGAADASSAARGFVPAFSQSVARGAHVTGFTIGYAVAFPACLVARLVPRNNAIVYGLTDGGRAGIDLARSTKRREPEPAPALAVVTA
jgi:hypothetical protein